MKRARIIQVNLNHARRAQDLMLQLLDERDVSVALITEPYRVPTGDPQWAGSPDGTAAITWRRTNSPLPYSRVKEGEGYVLARWGETYLVSVYLSPRLSLVETEDRLNEISSAMRTLGNPPTIIAGDFNAHATLWGSDSTNARGRLVLEWAAENNMCCMNRGDESTCVRAQGESIVDITWASPGCSRRIENWEVLSRTESLSDHVYVGYSLALTRGDCLAANRPVAERRWAIKKIDKDGMEAALHIGAWPLSGDGIPELPPADRVERLREIITRACEVAMPRAKTVPRKATYWWSDEIDGLRRDAIRARRQWVRSRRRRQPDPTVVEGHRLLYREAKKSLGIAIGKARAASWGELLSALDDDPWGLAYKLVRGKLRKWSPPITESLDSALLGEVIGTLFPEPVVRDRGESEAQTEIRPSPEQWDEDWQVSEEEMIWAIKRMTERNAAPGPDGIHAKAIALACRVVGAELRDALTDCLRHGVFPRVWKKASLVLLHKEGKEKNLPSSYRPICLLDEMGKILERIISRRLQEHLDTVGPNLHESQFGFRRGLSTMDAVLRVKEFAQREACEGRVVLAVSLDITNAFNSLPWDRIRESLTGHGFPPYMVAILTNYLSERTLVYRDGGGNSRTMDVRRGVPQGSVLGPLLWDIGYNRVLSDVALPPRCATVCYADDTLVLAAGRDWAESRSRVNEALAAVVSAISSLDLRVAPQKTEAVFMHDGSWGIPPEASIVVDGTRVQVGGCIKYLGLTLDGTWSFVQHFERLAPRLEAVANQCARLMPNLGGPGGKARRLYATAISSVALYGAPAWDVEAQRSTRILGILRAALRRVAIRVVRGYRTNSFAGATLLAGIPPWEITAGMYAETFRCSREERSAPGGLTPWRAKAIKIIAKRRMFGRWQEWARGRIRGGARVREVLAPRIVGWVDRKWGFLTFRFTQILTGHGCFGAFLHRIGKEGTPECHHCPALIDTAQHTLAECPAWTDQRMGLAVFFGRDLSLSNVVRGILQSREAWTAVTRFCEKVILQKEDAERERRGEGLRGTQQNPAVGRPRRGRGVRGGRTRP